MDLNGWALSAECVTVAQTRAIVVVTAVVMTEAGPRGGFETVIAPYPRRCNRRQCFRTDLSLVIPLTNGAGDSGQ